MRAHPRFEARIPTINKQLGAAPLITNVSLVRPKVGRLYTHPMAKADNCSGYVHP
jgi:hypothetical protein